MSISLSQESLLSLAGSLIERPSENPGGTEKLVAECIINRLNKSEVDFMIETQEVFPDRPNVIARAGNPSHGTVMLTGHMDVVPAINDEWSTDPYECVIDGDVLTGRGAADMKSAVAAQIVAAEAYLKENKDPGEVLLAFVVDEENGGTGTEMLLDRDIDADWAILGEPTDMNICVAQFGCVRYRITIQGQSAHAGYPEGGVNAISAVNTLLQKLKELEEQMEQYSHSLLGSGSVTVTEIQAGTAHNIVPGEATVTVDWRIPPGISESPEKFESLFQECISDVCLETSGLKLITDRYDFYAATEISPDNKAVITLQDAAKQAGISPEITGFPAGSDARYLIPEAEIPTVLFGPGSIESDAHTVNESITIPDLTIAAHTYLYALELFFTDTSTSDRDPSTE